MSRLIYNGDKYSGVSAGRKNASLELRSMQENAGVPFSCEMGESFGSNLLESSRGQADPLRLQALSKHVSLSILDD